MKPIEDNNPFINSLEGMQDVKSCIQLYSGGLDSRYFLYQARRFGIKTTALRCLLGAEDPTEVAESAEAARQLGATYIQIDCVEAFVKGFVSRAILLNARYNNCYPVCSSLSRPLIAEQAVGLARRVGAQCIVHSATWVQNSCARFNNTIRFLAPELRVAMPFASAPIDLETKVAELRNAVIRPPQYGVHSVDAKIWGRVIEAGELDEPFK